MASCAVETIYHELMRPLCALVNVGKSYQTFEPGVSVSWLSSKIGTEISLFAAGDFSTENDQTHYQCGDIFTSTQGWCSISRCRRLLPR